MLCNDLTIEQSNSLYRKVLTNNEVELMRELCRKDLFFLLTVGCKRKDVNRPWLYERCREVEREPDGFLDLWAREHYKSTIITFGKSIQDILCDPEETVAIFSHTRPIAKGFLEQIKREFEDNSFLQDLFPDILYKEPKREAPKWSLDGGIVVKRNSNPKEATVEAWGLVDGQPISKHFGLRVYDDVVTRESVTTPDQINKTTQAWELSDNLGKEGGRERYIGTRYHYNDTYRVMMERRVVKPRIYACTTDGTMEGDPVLMSKEDLIAKREKQGPYTFSAQMFQNPTADKAMGFKEEWLKFYDTLRNFNNWNFYLLVDPASEKKGKQNKDPDYTVIVIIGLAPDNGYYLVDGLRDRLNLTERTQKLFEFHKKYKPLKIGYEKYGKDSDIEHIEYVMEQENYRFPITPLGGAISKPDRIRKLVPVYEAGRFWLPHNLMFVDHEKRSRDFVREFIHDEYLAFPVSIHDDMLDCASRILDPELNAMFPETDENIKIGATYEKEFATVQTEYELFN